MPQILFSFGAIGVINSLIVSVYFLISKSYNHRINRLFGLFLFVLSLRVLKSIFYAFSTADSVWYINVGPGFFALIGPLLFSYIICITKPNSLWAKNGKYHIFLWFIIVVALIIIVPFKENVRLNKETILPIINILWFIYIFISALTILNFKTTKSNFTQYKWLVLFIIINLITWASFSLIDFNYFISGSIIFSIFFYSLFLFFLFNKRTMDQIFKRNKVKKVVQQSSELSALRDKLNEIIRTEKLHTNPNLKLKDLAEKSDLTTHELSKFLNDNLGMGFTDFINEYRIEEAKHLITSENHFTLEAIGNQSGFNSKSAFYKAFKKFSGITPAQYRASL